MVEFFKIACNVFCVNLVFVITNPVQTQLQHLQQ